jgi:hypothetical protein
MHAQVVHVESVKGTGDDIYMWIWLVSGSTITCRTAGGSRCVLTKEMELLIRDRGNLADPDR